MKLRSFLYLAGLIPSVAFGQGLSGSSITATSSASITFPSSTLTSGTGTSLTSGKLIASSATAGAIVVPSFAIFNAGGGALNAKINLSTNATSGWGAAIVNLNMWTAAPTYTNGDGGTYAATTGSAIGATFTLTAIPLN